MSRFRQSPEEKQAYWRKRMKDELEKGFKSTSEAIKRANSMGVFIGMKKDAFKDGIIEIGDGFNSLKAVIDGHEALNRKIPKAKK